MDMQEVFEAYRKYGLLEKVNTYIDRVLDANRSVLKEVLAMSSAAVRQIIFEHFEKDGTLDCIREASKRETALNMLKDGLSVSRDKNMLKCPLNGYRA